ncbi:MAG: hypothetical protein DYG96_07995 [Chlorobi bacterium CHB2]|nr:hypothetical protein [Chlorobi bacterium CHB2]
MPDFDLISSIAPILAALAAANERFVEALKSMIPGLGVDPRVGPEIAQTQEEENSTREGWIGLLSIATGILTAWLAIGAEAFPKGTPVNSWSPFLYGLLIAGGTRLWNPIIEYLKAIKDTKNETAAKERAQTPRVQTP